MNACAYCGKPTRAAVCTACDDMRDPELQGDRLLMACILHPKRAEALHKALTAPKPKREYHEPVWATFPTTESGAPLPPILLSR